MKSIVKIISLAVALVWISSAIAETGVASSPSGAEEAAPTETSKVPLVAKPENVDRTRVEKRLSDRAARIKKRTAVAEKAAADREAQAQQGQTQKTPASGAPK